MRTNKPPGEIVTVPAHQKETEIFIIEGILSYVNCTIRRCNFAVLRNSVNRPATYILNYPIGQLSSFSAPALQSPSTIKGTITILGRWTGLVF